MAGYGFIFFECPGAEACHGCHPDCNCGYNYPLYHGYNYDQHPGPGNSDADYYRHYQTSAGYQRHAFRADFDVRNSFQSG